MADMTADELRVAEIEALRHLIAQWRKQNINGLWLLLNVAEKAADSSDQIKAQRDAAEALKDHAVTAMVEYFTTGRALSNILIEDHPDLLAIVQGLIDAERRKQEQQSNG